MDNTADTQIQRHSSSLNQLRDKFSRAPALLRLIEGLRERVGSGDAMKVCGLEGASGAFMIDSVAKYYDGVVLVVGANKDRAEGLTQDLESLRGSETIRYFPDQGVKPYEFHSPSAEIVGRRIATISALNSGENGIYVTSPQALMEPTIAREVLEKLCVYLKVGNDYDLDELTRRLANLGFHSATNVEEVGDFAKRGGLVDFFSPSSLRPIRVEFFGDTIETIRTFDVATQRSLKKLNEISVLPRREIIYDPQITEIALSYLPEKQAEFIRARCVADPELPGLEWLGGALGYSVARPLDYLPSNTLLILDSPELIKEEFVNIADSGAKLKHAFHKIAEAPQTIEEYYQSPESQLLNQKAGRSIEILPFRGRDESVIDFDCKSPPPVGGKMAELANIISSYRIAEVESLISADNPGQAERIRDLLSDHLPEMPVPIVVGQLSGGFFSKSASLALLTDHQIFAQKYRRRKRKRYREGVALGSYTNLNRGDYVVHTDHGIARFLRLETLTVDKKNRDCLLLEYADEDKLYVPIEEFNRVGKYAGGNARPSLTRLGGNAWENLRAKAKKGIEDIAEKLVRLYAERKSEPGHAFGPDTTWMRKLEASFPYEETEDQQKAINDVKRDMEDSSCSDRLICGDVGFGKTEVAIRAALKCVEEGKQVAVLVPTTILAQQHYSTFKTRLAEFPLRIDTLSRFRTRSQQKITIEDLAAGKVDILIGTHRILSKDVEFRDLGLLVIDEEQRFGVSQKEKLRQIKTTVDTITLTATPIPRTLQMSLMGARDMSLISSSPVGRLPITTIVSEFSPEVIGESILREIDRDGQVFFVHNRVQSIARIQEYLKEILPQVTTLLAHGQMPERELEKVMIDFIEKRAQVLLCTAIIESGLDIPNVNTIIIDRADRFGMAQLYQLRGRVGRSSEQAYCYLLTPSYRRMTDESRRRLRAIEAHTELGSGFALAMRDLEIRGAGNILGAKQSGYIDEIGFDMYSKLLEEAVDELRGKLPAQKCETKIEVELEAYIPASYIDISQSKVDIYRKLADCRSVDSVEEIQEELKDRYGKFPQEVQNLLKATLVKLVATKLGLDKVRLTSTKATLIYPNEKQLERDEIEVLRKVTDLPLEFKFSPRTTIEIELKSIPESEIADRFLKILSAFWNGVSEKEASN